MGNEESKRYEENARRQGVSREEVNRLLEQQRREYERKLQQLNERTARAAQTPQSPQTPQSSQTPQPAPRPHPVRPAREANDDYINQVIAQQVQDFVQIAYNDSNTGPSRAAQPTRPQPSSPQQGPSTSSTERHRSPYSFTREELHNRSTKPPNLYPDLNAHSLGTPTAPNLRPEPNRFNSANANVPSDYVFVENVQTDRPSAPPLLKGPITNKQFNKPKPSPRNKQDETYCCKTCGGAYGINFIFQCSTGHSSCKACKERGVSCGVCSAPIGDSRNFMLEELIAERKTACPNSGDGCGLTLKAADVDNHLKECPFREFNCPLFEIFGQRERCRWRGKISQIVSHFDDIHPEHRQANIDTEMVLVNILDDNHIVHLIDLSPFIFIIHLKVSDNERKIYATVQLMGTQRSALKWTFELHIYNKREPRRKFLHTDVCYSNAVPIEDILTESKCAVIPQSYALSFINEGCLTYKFFIKRDVENNGPSGSRGKWRGAGRGRGRGRVAKVWTSQNA